MMLGAVLAAVIALVVTAALALVFFRYDRAALAIGKGGAVAASLAGAGGAVAALLSPAEEAWHGPPLPFGTLHLGLDALSAFFLTTLFVVSGLAALYGAGYLGTYLGKRRLAPPAASFNLLVAAMAVVVLARDGVLFLAAWEMMSVTSFFLVAFDSEREEVRRAAYTYLAASQLGAVFLFAAFGMLWRHAGSGDFAAVLAAGAPPAAAVIFVLALVGFGTKAGLWPLHIWLPEAHPAAPSHVSALMSGVLIKLGIYGILRFFTFLGSPPLWWGLVLLTAGAATALLGILHALAQTDLKRFLAYSSVENVGIVTLGLGIGVIGRTFEAPAIAAAGFAGALLHAFNHGLMKGLLFQAAGSVLHGTGAREIDALGGLWRRMRVTGGAFLAGALAIAALPPLNGFAGEWLLYVTAFAAGARLPAAGAVPAVFAVPVLALAGGLAAAAFVRAFGLVFLGEPRTARVSRAREANLPMRAAMVIGAALCAVLGLWPAGALALVLAPARSLVGTVQPAIEGAAPLYAITRAAVVLAVLVAALAAGRWLLLRRRDVRVAPTWGCGYALPTARMQYTAPSLAEPLLAPFDAAMPVRRVQAGPIGYFPAGSRYVERHADAAADRLVRPMFRGAVALLNRLRIIQQGRTQLYLTYVLITLVLLLIWQLGLAGR